MMTVSRLRLVALGNASNTRDALVLCINDSITDGECTTSPLTFLSWSVLSSSTIATGKNWSALNSPIASCAPAAPAP